VPHQAGLAELTPLLCRYRYMEHWEHEAMPCPFWRCYWSPDRHAWIRRGSEQQKLGPDHWVLLSPGQPVQTGQEAPFEHLFFHFSLGPQLRNRKELLLQGPLQARDQELLQRIRSTHLNRRADALQWMAFIWNCLAQLPEDSWYPPVQDARIREALEQIRNSAQTLKLDELAQTLGMHPKSFSRLFKEQVGLPPYRYALEIRLDAAAQELHHGEESVEQIAERWGFTDRYHFSRMLSKYRGTTPGKLRASH